MFTYNGQLYVVTARHTLKNINPLKVLICYALDSTETLQFDSISHPEPLPGFNDDLTDISFFRVDTQRLPQITKTNWRPVSLGPSHFCSSFTPGMRLIGRGFSVSHNYIEYGTKTIKVGPANIFASYMRPCDNGLHEIKFETFAHDFDLNGISGSPVFCYYNMQWCLAGMMIRGTTKSHLGRFIESRIILECLASLDN